MRRSMTLLLCVVCIIAALSLTGCKGAYVGSSMSHRFHDPACLWAKELPGERAVWFDSLDEAVEAGYEPCSTCEPGSAAE